MMAKKNAAAGSSSVKYHRLQRAGNDGFVDMQFEKPPPKVPYRAILLASILFLAGTILIVIGALLLTGYIPAKYADRTWPMLILGSIMFIPGAYHVRIAVYAYRGYVGYSFEDIPEFE